MSFTGTWQVVSSPDFDDDYLQSEGKPYIKLLQSEGRVDGEYQIGLQTGEIDGRVQGDNQMIFSFEGNDESEEVHGAGVAVVTEDHLSFVLLYHMGDNFTFEAERENPKKA